MMFFDVMKYLACVVAFALNSWCLGFSTE